MEKIKELYKKHKEIINYIIVGLLTTVVSIGTYFIVTSTFLNPENPFQLQVANVISWVFAVIFAYFANRKFVFESKEKNVVKEASKFAISRVGTLLMDMLIMFVGVNLLKINDKIMKLVVQVVVTIANYIIGKFLVFKKKEK